MRGRVGILQFQGLLAGIIRRSFNWLRKASRQGGGALPVNLVFGQVFRRVNAIGVDGSVNAGKWILRGESAYIMTPNNDGTNPLEIPTHWDSVFGIERSFWDDFRIQTQFIYRTFPKYSSPDGVGGPDPISVTVNQTMAQDNALLLNYQDQTRPSGTLRFGYLNEKNGIDGEIFFLQNFTGGDYLLRPRLTYAWTDFLKTTVGAELYGGPTNRPLGGLNSYSAIFSEVKYTF